MNTTKSADRVKSSIMYWITVISILLFYITCSVLILIIGLKNHSLATGSENLDVLQIIWDSLGNAGTLIPLVVAIISAWVLKKKHKKISWSCICFISVAGFILYCFYNIVVKYPVHPVIVAGVGLCTYIVGVLVIFLQPTNIVIKQGSVIRSAFGNRIRNAKIAGIQLFECAMTEDDDNVNYCIQSVDHLSNEDSDINGMLSVRYQLKKTDVNGFDFVTKTYQALVESANDSTKDELIRLIEDKCSGIKTRLQRLASTSDVTKNDCCLARLMIMYNAYLNILRPSGSSTTSAPDAYIGECDLRNGEMGVDVEIQNRLFTFVRTGLLGGILVGPNCIYHFQYRKDGYKTGRQYCVFHLKNENSVNQNRFFMCLVVIKDGATKTIPPYLLQAIRKMIPVLEESLQKAIQEVDS